MTKHTASCIKYTENAASRVAAWVQRRPNYCKKCGGEGVLEGCDWVPYGSGPIPMVSYELCSCMEDDLCPRCASKMGLSDDWEGEIDGVCPVCGWSSENPDMCPLLPEGPCECEIQEVEDSYQRYLETDRYAQSAEGETK